MVGIRPGAEVFQYAALAPVLAAFAYAFMQITARKLGGTERASTMAFYIQGTFVVVCATSGIALGDGRFAGAFGGKGIAGLPRLATVITVNGKEILVLKDIWYGRRGDRSTIIAPRGFVNCAVIFVAT